MERAEAKARSAGGKAVQPIILKIKSESAQSSKDERAPIVDQAIKLLTSLARKSHKHSSRGQYDLLQTTEKNAIQEVINAEQGRPLSYRNSRCNPELALRWANTLLHQAEVLTGTMPSDQAARWLSGTPPTPDAIWHMLRRLKGELRGKQGVHART